MRGAGEWRRNVGRFLVENQWLLWLLLLFLAGVEIGCVVFRSAARPLGTALYDLLRPTIPAAGLWGAAQTWLASCSPPLLLLLFLFFVGFFAGGVVPALIVPLFYGAGVGLTEAYFFAQGGRGVGYVALLVIPHTLVSTTALLIASAQAVKLSARLCRQLLPRKSLCSTLWPEVKLYCARFLLCAGLLLTAGAVDTVLQMCFVHHFV